MVSYKELKSIQENSMASAAELREFFSRMKGKSPKEMLGVIAQSGLASSLFLATVGCVVLLAVLTIVPYAMKEDKTEQQAVAPAKEPANAPVAKPQPPVQPSPADAAAKPPAENPETPVDPAAAAAAMGIDKTKTADPDKNPLEGDLDNLLDGIK